MATASARLLSLGWLRGTFLAAPPAPRDEWASLAATLLDTSSWTLLHFVCFGVAVQVGFEFYRTVVPRLFSRASSLQARGRHLDSFSARDKAYIATNMALVQLMAFHYFQAKLSLTHTHTRTRTHTHTHTVCLFKWHSHGCPMWRTPIFLWFISRSSFFPTSSSPQRLRPSPGASIG